MKVWTRGKDPDELLRYSYDWSPDLAEGETLVTEGIYPFVDPVAPAGTTVQAVQQDDTHATLIISGGTDGQEAAFLIRVKTSVGNILEDTVVLPIAAKVIPVVHPGGYVDPTPANLAALYPEFGSVSPVQLQYYLDRAAVSVDTSWSEGDFAHARMVLAAHLLTLGGIGDSAEAATVREGSGEFRSMGIGPLRLERFDKGSGKSTYATTRYGREFRDLLRRNKGGPRVAGYQSAARLGDGDNFGPWTA